MSSTFNWKPYAIGLAITVVVVGIAWMAYSRQSSPSGQLDNAYASQVSIAEAKVSAAESMMAGGIVYYDGMIVNHGDRTLTGYTVKLTFSDLYGKPVGSDRRVLLDDHLRPVAPHSSRSFEIGFDKVPAGWNQAPPEPQAIAVYVH